MFDFGEVNNFYEDVVFSEPPRILGWFAKMLSVWNLKKFLAGLQCDSLFADIQKTSCRDVDSWGFWMAFGYWFFLPLEPLKVKGRQSKPGSRWFLPAGRYRRRLTSSVVKRSFYCFWVGFPTKNHQKPKSLNCFYSGN